MAQNEASVLARGPGIEVPANLAPEVLAKVESNTKLPAVHLHRSIIDSMLQATLGKSVADVETDIDTELKPQSATLPGWTASLEVNVERLRAPAKNVIGYTQLWMLPTGGHGTAVRIGVASQEQDPQTYSLELRYDGRHRPVSSGFSARCPRFRSDVWSLDLDALCSSTFDLSSAH